MRWLQGEKSGHGSDGLTDRRAAIGRERVVCVNDVKTTTLKENKNKIENKIQVNCLWRWTQTRTITGLSHKPYRDARPRLSDAQSATIMILAWFLLYYKLEHQEMLSLGLNLLSSSLWYANAKTEQKKKRRERK